MLWDHVWRIAVYNVTVLKNMIGVRDGGKAS